jgi:hypothetical protein
MASGDPARSLPAKSPTGRPSRLQPPVRIDPLWPRVFSLLIGAAFLLVGGVFASILAVSLLTPAAAFLSQVNRRSG